MESATSPSTTASVTSDSLLAGLADSANRTVWQQFIERYRPPIVRFARKRGLTADNAEDAAQQTLLAFAQAYQDGRYDRQKGRLRIWLFGIARNQIRRARRQERNRELPLDSELAFPDAVNDGDPEHALWEREWQHEIFRTCLGQIRCLFDAQTLGAFELFACQGWSANKVAVHLGMSENAVYLAKHRVLKRIRELLPQMQDIF